MSGKRKLFPLSLPTGASYAIDWSKAFSHLFVYKQQKKEKKPRKGGKHDKGGLPVFRVLVPKAGRQPKAGLLLRKIYESITSHNQE